MTRTRTLPLAVLVATLFVSPANTHASGQERAPSLVRTTFRLAAEKGVPRGTTYWLAYGPVAGQFGLIRMRRSARGYFVASGRFPKGERATFYYIEGQGVIHTKAGLAPGNPVRTVGHVGPLAVGRRPIPLVRVAPAVG